MPNICKKNTTTLKVVNGSILTFECIANISNDITNSFILQFTDYLSEGAKYIEDFGVIVSYSTDCGGTYNRLENFDGPSFDSNELSIIFDQPIPKSIDYDYTLLKINFKALVTNIDTPNCILVNKSTFSSFSWLPLDPSDFEKSITSYYLIKKYDFMLAGYSLNICTNSCNSSLKSISPCSQCLNSYSLSEELRFKKDFNATFLFNAISGDYGIYSDNGSFTDTAEYVITINPTTNVTFPTTEEDFKKIKISIANSCLCHGTEIENIFVEMDDDSLVITIPHIGTANIITDDNTNLNCSIGGKTILITIPCSINECITSPFFIEGSIQLINTVNGDVLASLDSFCLCVNSRCSTLMAVGKNILC
ncbi:MAG: hypothetical protein Q4B63_08420 [Clostridium perfringens]|nr:hypothetical protein [Clostridium perfringens]